MNIIKPGLNGFCGSFPTSFPVKELILLGIRPCLLSSMPISKTPAQGRWNSGRAVKELRQWNLIKNKNRYQLYFFCSNNVDRKNNSRNYRNHSEFYGCVNSCNKFVLS